MHFYRVLYEGPADVSPSDWSHHGTQAQAHTAAKGYGDRDGVRVELIDVQSDKAGILSLLQGYSPADSCDNVKVLKTWKLTARGGLTEVPNGE